MQIRWLSLFRFLLVLKISENYIYYILCTNYKKVEANKISFNHFEHSVCIIARLMRRKYVLQLPYQSSADAFADGMTHRWRAPPQFDWFIFDRKSGATEKERPADRSFAEMRHFFSEYKPRRNSPNHQIEKYNIQK